LDDSVNVSPSCSAEIEQAIDRLGMIRYDEHVNPRRFRLRFRRHRTPPLAVVLPVLYTIVYDCIQGRQGANAVELYIEGWDWDDGNIDHLALRGISPELIEDEVWLEAPRYLANRKGRSASHLMVGPDSGGRFWTICILQVEEDPAFWRAITGWQSKPHEIQWYRRSR
jgi:hypothetical protein